MAYGKLKADTLVYDNSGSDVEVTISTLGNKAGLTSPDFVTDITLLAAAPVKFNQTNNAAAVSLKAPGTGVTSYTITLPAVVGGSGKVLKTTDGAGTLEWGDPGLTLLDEDNFASDSATAAASQQSIKAYAAPKAAPAFTGTATGVNLTLSGDLTVNGTTTTIDTTNLTVEDPLISLAKNNDSANTVDIGFYGLYDATGSQDVYAGLFRDASDSGKWKLFELNQAAPTTTVDTSGTGYAAATLVVGTVEDSKGNVRNIPASTNTTLVAADAGKHISITAGITINASTDFAIGDAVTIFNNQAAGNNETITATGIDLYLATDASVSGATNRTLAPRGVATILCVAADKYVITGAGLT